MVLFNTVVGNTVRKSPWVQVVATIAVKTIFKFSAGVIIWAH